MSQAIPISAMAAGVKPSATLAAAAKARALKAEGIHVYDFSVGEPDFPTPEHIQQAAIAAMKAGHTHYTAANGLLELRQAVARWYQRYHGLRYGPDQVLISNGAKHSIHNVLAATVGPGDEVLIPSPYWVSYSDLVEMTGAKYVLLETSWHRGFKITPAQLQAAITPRTRLLMLNSPCNPTGMVYSRGELEALADVVVRTGITVMSDEIYEHLVYGGVRTTCFVTLRPELVEQTITVSGVSKSYAMTGWRIGWALGPMHVIKAMGNIQSQETSSPCSISQYAALAALEGDQECVEAMRQEFEARRDLVCERLTRMPGIQLQPPDGAFYAFFRVADHFGRTFGGRLVTDSVTFCQAALEAAHVNLVPGAFFGAEGFARLSFAASRAELTAGLDALERWLRS
ncbi:MAG: pyridoxal phosphate-dependent aminotransferase [Gemmataceae bacterium]|nr:pyridoxal phosphate-dependent aminotransferase [Gemmataceae bacterium]MDW8264672.1 pyridoxal phosphate-dependent aminotransferase [Gemmataceae bacterium]